ncbi:LysR family transcriptional regulator [Sphingomonas sp. PR090111-T3T-6A]|uniref:LysR family transcriptional regulator n=1 Tax=Sphingomonas sp. PR090111-T3T-6A TaxID=685778 RepID=UPI001F22E659|nr:LysR family transcriptional regulator [Sphingomonas sp. PR090111-T3T-6A]
MEWSDVRIFLTVARSGTLGSAARALHLSHPTIGRHLSRPPARLCSRERRMVSY